MRMPRLRVALTATVLLAASVVIPPLAALRLSWYLAVNTESEHLTSLGDDSIRSAEDAFSDARSALDDLNASQLTPCSPEHISMMQVLNSNISRITGVGYIDESGYLRCSANGLVTGEIRYPSESRVDYGDLGLVLDLIPHIDGSSERMSVRLGNYDVLIDPDVLLGRSGDPTAQMAVALDGVGVVTDTHGPDESRVVASLGHSRSGSDGTWIYGAAKSDGWSAALLEPVDAASASYERNKWVLLPVAALVSLTLIGLSWSLLRWSGSMRTALTIAIWRKDLTVHYQPIVETGNGECVGVEALVRWPRRDGTVVGPDVFVPVAERYGVIHKLTDFVIARSVRDLGAKLTSTPSFYVSINLSAGDGSTRRVIDVLADALRGTGIHADQIWLELTERELIDVESAQPVLTELREHGYRIAIDDFGTGFSNLRSLEKLPVDALKLDKSFVDAIGRSTSRSPVLPHIIEMTKALDLMCVAEGVETQEQLDYLRVAGVDRIQGWLISRPRTADDVLAFVDGRKTATWS